MLTKDDLNEIKQLLQPLERKVGALGSKVGSLEDKLGSLEDKIDDLSLETKAIHKIIETQGEEYEKRIGRLEQETGIN